MKKSVLGAVIVAGMTGTAAHAGLEATVGLYSDYIFRGVSQTDEDPTPQASLDWFNDDGWYAGIWASDVDFGLDDEFEIDYYGGYASALDNGWEYDIGINYYTYPGSDDVLDYPEVLLNLTYDWFRAQIGYTWDNYGTDESALYLQVGGEFELANEFSLHASVGVYDFSSPENQFFDGAEDGYSDWIIGVSRSWNGFDFTLDYMDTSSDAEDLFGKNLSEGRVVFSVSRTFSLIE